MPTLCLPCTYPAPTLSAILHLPPAYPVPALHNITHPVPLFLNVVSLTQAILEKLPTRPARKERKKITWENKPRRTSPPYTSSLPGQLTFGCLASYPAKTDLYPIGRGSPSPEPPEEGVNPSLRAYPQRPLIANAPSSVPGSTDIRSPSMASIFKQCVPEPKYP